MADLRHEEKIADMMGFYQKAFPVQSRIDNEGLAIYSKMLSVYSIPQLKSAMDKIMMTSKYFPSIAEIREAVEALAVHVTTEGKGIPTVGDAWKEALREAERKHTFFDKWEFSTPEIERTVNRFGKRDLINLEDKDIGIAKAQFRDMYKEELRRSSERKTNNAVLAGSKLAGIVDKLASSSTRVFVLEGAH